jgi:hypothetical protein
MYFITVIKPEEERHWEITLYVLDIISLQIVSSVPCLQIPSNHVIPEKNCV